MRLLTDYAEAQGLPLSELLTHHGLQPAALDAPEGRIPFQNYDKLLADVAQQLDDDFLGMHLGSIARLTHLGTGGLAQMACSTVQELLPRMKRYSSLNIDAFSDDIDVEGNELVLRWVSCLPADFTFSRHHSELNFALTQSLVPQFTGVALFPTRVCFAHDAPKDPTVLNDFFNCEVEFNAPVNQLACDISVLDLKLQPASPAALQVLDQICAQQLKAIEALKEPDWLSNTKQAISKSLRHGQPELSQVAEASGLAPRQLRRRLTDQGLSFRNLVDKQRQDLAQAYIADPSLSLVEVAMLLGFSEQSAFQRAFRRWTGQAPGSVRRQYVS